jgi:hypothetical protein
MKLEINSKKNWRNYTNKWGLKNILNDQWVTDKIGGVLKNFWETNENWNTTD